ncbi:MAG: methyltransferase domain-containing protein [Candidatus Omnitrophica bacterium]|nr:methyltransferase domain-containing protein [Candidatus Omnitrophota bacterium]
MRNNQENNIRNKSQHIFMYHAKFKRLLYKAVGEYAAGKEHCKILDIGCGRGNDLSTLCESNQNLQAFGMDVSGENLSATGEAKKNISFFQGDALNLPVKDRVFEIIITSEMIEHVEKKDAVRFIGELYRVLKDGGRLVVTTPSRHNYTSLLSKIVPAVFKNKLRKLVWHIRPGQESNPHAYEYTPRELAALFSRGGFFIEKIKAGVMRIPLWPLFVKLPFLLLFWKCLDGLINIIPGGINLKHNFVLIMKKG